MSKYLAYDGISGEYEQFDTIEEAREWLKESFYEGQEYHPDIEQCKIYIIHEKAEYDVLDRKIDNTPQEWEDKGYNEDWDEIWQHKFVPCNPTTEQAH